MIHKCRLTLGLRAYTVGVLLFAALLGLAFMAATGCAAGRNEANGEIVVGFAVGRLVETAEQGVAAAAEWGLAALGVGSGGVAGIGLLLRKLYRAGADAAAARARHEGETKGWNDAVLERGLGPAAPVGPAAPTPPGVTT